MQSRPVTTALPPARPRFLPWALILLLLAAQLSAGEHKASLDGHEAGQFCHACVLFDRDDARPTESVSADLPSQHMQLRVFVSETDLVPDSHRRTPPSRASPVFHA